MKGYVVTVYKDYKRRKCFKKLCC